MSPKRFNLRLIGAFAVLATLALAISCTGFFQSPTLTGVSVGPQSLSINVNQTWQMSATGTYNDGSQKALTSGVSWSSSDPTTVTVGQTSGIVTGIQNGQATITASAGSCSACSGTSTVTVVLTGVTSVVVTPGSQSLTVNGTAVAFTAKANGTINISSTATWNILDSTRTDQTSEFSLSPVSGTEQVSTSAATPGTYTVQATYNGFVGKATLTVVP
jgi:trimeric autotransporter adhesin